MERRTALGLIAATGAAAALPAAPAFGAEPGRAAVPAGQSGATDRGGYTFAPAKNVTRTSVRFKNRYSEDVRAQAPGTVDLVIVPGADHVDLYDRKDLIPFDRLDEFFTENL